MRRILGALLVALLVSPTLHAEELKFNWAPTIIYASGRAVDQWSTHRFLNNGSGCVEGIAALGTHPSTAKLTAFNGIAVAAVAGMSYALHRGVGLRNPKLAQRLNWVTGLVGGSLGVKYAIRNVRECPAR
jgi:hypothetical protein